MAVNHLSRDSGAILMSRTDQVMKRHQQPAKSACDGASPSSGPFKVDCGGREFCVRGRVVIGRMPTSLCLGCASRCGWQPRPSTGWMMLLEFSTFCSGPSSLSATPRALDKRPPALSSCLFADLVMSSHAVATSIRGLPDFSSPPLDLDKFAEPEATWTDRSNLHHPDSEVQNEVDPPENSNSPITPSPPGIGMDEQSRTQAVGNLLAALAPVSPPHPATATEGADTGTEAGKSTGASPITENGANAFDAPATGDMNNETLATDQTTSLPPLPPLLNDEFMDEVVNTPVAQLTDSLEQSQIPPLGPENMALASQNEPNPHPPVHDSLPERREIEAFAKIEFEDGNYYITTYACELGRDAFAYRQALARAEEARLAGQEHAQSSSGRRSEGIPRPGDSQVQGSVVSEAGGFGGVDDHPLLENKEGREAHAIHSQSSERSGGSVVKPQEVLINPPLIPFDYHKMAERQAQLEHEIENHDPDNEQPAPVTADHIPDAHNCPLIPIHAMRNFQKSEVENHRSISRRHVKIQWDFEKECFQMRVLGRNGAFLDDQYVPRHGVKRLRDGSKIQISNVWMSFRLPNQQAESPSEESGAEEADQSPAMQRSTSSTSNEQDRSVSPSRTGKTKTKITLLTSDKPTPPTADPIIGPDGQPVPPRKRGPGRPPKDGIMSTRERREREKAQKLAEAKAANGGRTPPPMMRGKPPKPIIKEEPVMVEPKPEKRKYKKRKRPGEEGDVVQSIEGGEIDIPTDAEKPPPVKKAKQSKSPSPEYPPVETLTEEQLARPSEPYARLIYDILIDIHPKALPLKQIYRALKLKFPFFVHRVDSEGWQSSVRHNLNQEWNKLFEKGEKEGKGFAWKAIPGALQPQAERRRAAQQAAAAKPKPTPPQRPGPQVPPPMLNWQNSTAYPQQNGMPPRGPPPPFFAQGPHGPMPPPPNGMPWPPPPPPAGMAPSASPNSNGVAPQMAQGQNPPAFYPPPPGGRPAYPGQQPSSQAGAGQPTASAQGPARPPSTPSTPAPAAIPSSSSASRNMPCTTDGLMAIRRFETAMYEQVGDATKIEQWQKIFSSVKRRLLHGYTESSLQGGETKEELTIMEHVRRFIDRFKNPNFVGFSKEQAKVTGSPAPAPAAGGNAPAPATTLNPPPPAITNNPPLPSTSVNPLAPVSAAGNPAPPTPPQGVVSVPAPTPSQPGSSEPVKEIPKAQPQGQAPIAAPIQVKKEGGEGDEQAKDPSGPVA